MIKIDKSSWKKVKISDVFEKKEENDKLNAQKRFDRFLKVEHMDAESLHIKRWSSQEAGEEINPTFYKIFRAGQVLFPTRNPHLRRTALAHFDGICGEKTLTLEPNKELVDERYIPFLFHSEGFYSHSTAAIIGSTNPHCRWRDIANYEFLLPPKEQQTELADLLWAMDEVIEKDLAVLERLEIAFKVNANQSLNIGYADDFISLPKGWKVNKLKEIAKVNSGSTPLRANKDFFENGTVPWVKTLDLNNGVISSTEESITELALSKTSCKKRSVGTVLVAMYGGFNQIGRTGILEIEAATNQAISAIDLNRELIRPKYLLYVLNSRIDYWKKVAVSSRKDPNITKADVENFPVVYPSLDTQDAIIAEIDLMKVSNAKIESKIAASKALQKSLINEIF